jgi:hypothetical protein
VSSTRPWVVGGIPLAVTNNTRIRGEVGVGDLVKVEGVLVDGQWQAEEIKRLDPDLGCFNFSAGVLSVDAGQLVLQGGQTLTLGEQITVEGDLRTGALIIIFGCVREDGDFIIVTIIVIGQIELPPVEPTSTPQPQPTTAPPPSTGPIVITENNQTLTLTCSGNPVTINGNDNTMTLLGAGSSRTVRGNSNRVTVQGGVPVTNTGNNNVIQQP